MDSNPQLMSSVDSNPDIPERYVCGVCREIMGNPYLMVCCGKKCCECLEHWFQKKKGKLSCPYCRSSIYRVLDKGLKKEIECLDSSFYNHSSQRKSTSSAKYDGKICNFETPFQTRLICKICNSVLKDPHLAKCCGEKFCYSCIQNLDKKSKKGLSVCPNCRSLLRHVEEKELKSEVNSLKVCCSNMGCPWKDELSSYVKHLEECSHRIVECEHCRVEYKFMTYQNHLTECGKMPIACPNNCGEMIFRESMTGHRQECKLELVKCKHSKEGCKEMIRRKDLKEHLKDHVIYKQCSVCKRSININESEFHYNSCAPMTITRTRTRTRTRPVSASNCFYEEGLEEFIRYFQHEMLVNEDFRRQVAACYLPPYRIA